MDRFARTVGWTLGLLVLSGCVGSQACKVRETTAPDAQNIHADSPTLLPAMPVTSTSATRGQNPAKPPVPSPPVQQTGAVSNEPQVAVQIRAQVNGLPILDEEVREALVMKMGELAQIPESRRAEVYKEMTKREIDRLIERELILEDAFKKIKEIKKPQLLDTLKKEAAKEADRQLGKFKTATKIAGDAEFAAFLQQQGLSVSGFRRQIERNFMMSEYVNNVIFPSVQRISLQQVRDFYDENQQLFSMADRVKWQDLFIDASRFANAAAARQHAETIAARARAGEDFAGLVKQFDHGDSNLRNGEGLGQKRGEIKPPVAEPVVFGLKIGEVGPVIDMGFGYHIVKVIERDYAGCEPFDDKCQAKVRDKLRMQIYEREVKRMIADLKRTATIVIAPN